MLIYAFVWKIFTDKSIHFCLFWSMNLLMTHQSTIDQSVSVNLHLHTGIKAVMKKLNKEYCWISYVQTVNVNARCNAVQYWQNFLQTCMLHYQVIIALLCHIIIYLEQIISHTGFLFHIQWPPFSKGQETVSLVLWTALCLETAYIHQNCGFKHPRKKLHFNRIGSTSAWLS